MLAGKIPAATAEIVKRAKVRAALRAGDPVNFKINSADLVAATRLLDQEREFLAAPNAPAPHPMTLLGDAFGTTLGSALHQAMASQPHVPTLNGAGKMSDFVGTGA